MNIKTRSPLGTQILCSCSLHGELLLTHSLTGFHWNNKQDDDQDPSPVQFGAGITDGCFIMDGCIRSGFVLPGPSRGFHKDPPRPDEE